MKKKLIATFLSMALFGALNTAHCAEPGVSIPDSKVSNINTAIFSLNQEKQVTAAISGSEKADETEQNFPLIPEDPLANTQTDKAYQPHTQDQLMGDISDSGKSDEEGDTEQNLVTAAISDSEKDDKKGDGQEKQGTDGRSNVIQFNNLPVLGSLNQFADTQTKKLSDTQAKKLSDTQANKFSDAQTNHWDQRPQQKTYKMIRPSGDTLYNIADKVVELLDIVNTPNITKKNMSFIYKTIKGGHQVHMIQGKYPRVHQHRHLKGGAENATLHISLPGNCKPYHYYDNLHLNGRFKVYTHNNYNVLQIDIIDPYNLLRARNKKLHIKVIQFLDKRHADELRTFLDKKAFPISIELKKEADCMNDRVSSNYQKNVANYQKNVANKY